MTDGPQLKHPEWVLFYRQGVTPEKIAELNEVPVQQVRKYLGRIRYRHPELLAGRLVLHDQPQPNPRPRADPDTRWRAALDRFLAFTSEHGRRPAAGHPDEFPLAHWLTTQRSLHRRGRLAQRRSRWLDAAHPNWRTDTRTLNAKGSRSR